MEMLCKQPSRRLEGGLLGRESRESVGDPGAGSPDIVIQTMPCGVRTESHRCGGRGMPGSRGEQPKGPGVELCSEGPGAAWSQWSSTVVGRLLGGAARTRHHRKGPAVFTVSKRESGGAYLSYCPIAVRRRHDSFLKKAFS